jgi:hypothetical protein
VPVGHCRQPGHDVGDRIEVVRRLEVHLQALDRNDPVQP